MTAANSLVFQGALVMLIAACATYFVRVFDREAHVVAACRVNIARHYIALLVVLQLYLLFLIWNTVVMPALGALAIVGIAVVLLILAILVVLTLQNAVPNLQGQKKTKAVTNAIYKLLEILTGRPPPVSGDVDLVRYYFSVAFALTGPPPLTKGKLLEMADLLEEMKADRDAPYDANGAAEWVTKSGFAGSVVPELDRLLAAIDECLAAADLSDAEKAKLEKLKEELKKLKDALTPPQEAGAGTGH